MTATTETASNTTITTTTTVTTSNQTSTTESETSTTEASKNSSLFRRRHRRSVDYNRMFLRDTAEERNEEIDVEVSTTTTERTVPKPQPQQCDETIQNEFKQNKVVS